MRARAPYELPPEQEKLRAQAARLEWITIGYMLSVIVLLGLVAGQSQAMKTAWIEDMLTLVPPIAFLVAGRIARKRPNERFPYGYHRATSIAFLCASAALLAIGVLLLLDSGLTLARGERPTIGIMVLFGHPIWQGWVMLPVLLYAIVPAVILGRKKLPLARDLHDKVLFADADMNKADWSSGAAAMLGILGVAFGFWWADAAAASAISLSILHDGWKNLSQVVRDLLDEVPTAVGEDQPDPLPERLKKALLQLDWVAEAEVRLREEGHVFTGELFVVPCRETDLLLQLERAHEHLKQLDWRLADFSIVPVRSLRSSQALGKSAAAPGSANSEPS